MTHRTLPPRVSGELEINGTRRRIEAWEDGTLLDVLRGSEGLTGAKRGCDIGTCGTCTVLVDGRARKSCSYSITNALADDPVIVTAEGLGDDDLHPMAAAFVRHGAVQCGYCTPGLVLAATALAHRKPNLEARDVHGLLKAQLCRCTGYEPIVRAILEGAAVLNGAEPTPVPDGSGIGVDALRRDGVEKATGHCLYTADQTPQDCLHGALRRSDRPHALIVDMDVSAAESMPGVHAVLTHRDVPGASHYGNAIADMPALCIDRVRFVGDAIAIVVADDPRIAREAADRIAITWRDLPRITSARAALEPDAPKLHPEGNTASHQRLRKGDATTALAGAAVSVSGHYRTPSQEHACLEPEAAIAWIDGEDLVIHAPSQNVYFDRREISRVTGWDKRRVVVRQQPMGAAFGKREDLYCQHHAAIATLALGGRPVKIEMSREESFICTTKRHAFDMEYEIGADADGRIVGLRASLWADTGAYASWAPNILRKALVHGAGAYCIDAIAIDAWSVYTNNGYAGAFRGFGAPQVFFAVESAIDELAEALGMDPLELRRRNRLELGSRTATGQELPASVGLGQCLDAVEEASGWGTPLPPAEDGWVRGRGVAQSFYGIGYGNGIPDIGSAILEIEDDGRICLRISTVDYGQGSSTLFPQIVCEEMGVPRSQVRLVSGDSSQTPDSGSTVASRQTYISGNAVLLATERLKQTIRRAAAKHFDVPESEVRYADGQVTVAGTNYPLAELVEQTGILKTQARFKASTTRLDPDTAQGDAYWPYAYGAQVAEVSVHLATGRLRVDRLVAAQDVGKALNPQMVEGQVRGAVAMGAGLALMEDYRFEDGVPLDTNFDTYRIPSYADLPNVDVLLVEDPEPTGPYGAKGVGEPPITPTAPAIANAVAAAIGARIRTLPLTRERILEALASRS